MGVAFNDASVCCKVSSTMRVYLVKLKATWVKNKSSFTLPPTMLERPEDTMDCQKDVVPAFLAPMMRKPGVRNRQASGEVREGQNSISFSSSSSSSGRMQLAC